MADEELEQTGFDEEGEDGEKKKGGGLKKIIIIVLALVILGGGGYFAYTMFFAGGDEPPPAAKPAQGEAKPGEAQGQAGQPTGDKAAADNPEASVYPLDPFIVNLSDPTGNRYLKVKLALDLSSKALADEVQKKIPRIRDAVLLLLSSKSFNEIASVEGKLKLRSELLHRINQALTKGRVSTLYFTDFVVQ